MATKSEALKWIAAGYNITPIRVTYDRNGHASKQPFRAYATDETDKLWVLSNWKRNFEIGLVLSGEDYVVFDFDSMQVFERFKLTNPTIESGVIEHSISGRGVHVYFENTEYITQVIEIIDGLDIKASRNNFVVVNPETDLSEAVELPQELWSFYESNKNNNQVVISKNITTAQSIPELSMITDGFGKQGQRNNNMSLLVWTLFTLGFDEQQTKAVVDIANDKSGLPQIEVDRTIETAWKKWSNGS
jgi:hypothetical protein